MIRLRNVSRIWAATAALPAASVCLAGICLAGICLAGTGQSSPSSASNAPPVLQAMQQELQRTVAAYSKADPPSYFVAYAVTDEENVNVSGSNGALLSSSDARNRWLEVQTRIGGYSLDNTHKIEGREPEIGR